MKNKNLIRQQLSAKRKQMTDILVTESSDKICSQLAKWLKNNIFEQFIVYYPFQNEVNILPIVESLLSSGKRTFFPQYQAKNKIYALAEVKDLEKDLTLGRYGIPEPANHLTTCQPDELTNCLWIIPGVAFDREGSRLGRGGGYYDRLLHKGKGTISAVAYNWQLIDDIPVERHDQKVDIIVTEDEILTTF